MLKVRSFTFFGLGSSDRLAVPERWSGTTRPSRLRGFNYIVYIVICRENFRYKLVLMSEEPPETLKPWPTVGKTPKLSKLGPRFFAFIEALDGPVVFFDLETTGTDTQRDRIVEICLLRVSPLPVGIESPRTWRINPEIRIPSEASDIHGIYNADVDSCPTLADIADDVLAIMQGAILSGFAITRMDLRMLQTEMARVGKRFDPSGFKTIDSQVIYHKREPRNLSAAVQFYCDEELEGAHGAEADTVASLQVFAGQLQKYEDLELGVEGLHEISTSLNAAFVDAGRRFVWKDKEPVFNFGKLRGRSLRSVAGDPGERDYLRWIVQGPFEADTQQLVCEALEGKIRVHKGT